MEAFLLFHDRSSLRVTDVSSVVFRDFALWFVYVRGMGAPAPSQVPAALISSIEDKLRDQDEESLEFVLTTYLDQRQWSKLR